MIALLLGFYVHVSADQCFSITSVYHLLICQFFVTLIMVLRFDVLHNNCYPSSFNKTTYFKKLASSFCKIFTAGTFLFHVFCLHV